MSCGAHPAYEAGCALANAVLAQHGADTLSAGARYDLGAMVIFNPFLPSFAEFTMMGLVIVVLAWRPAGLFGMAET